MQLSILIRKVYYIFALSTAILIVFFQRKRFIATLIENLSTITFTFIKRYTINLIVLVTLVITYQCKILLSKVLSHSILLN